VTPEEKAHYRNQLGQLSTIIRGQENVTKAVAGLTTAVWETKAEVSAMGQQIIGHERRLGLVESWRDAKDDELTATGTHRLDQDRRGGRHHPGDRRHPGVGRDRNGRLRLSLR
jgi:hypothetical protein